MASSPNPYTKRRSSPPTPSVSATKSTTNGTTTGGGGFFCKSVLFALFLLALPLFPSQAPDFVGETVFTKFWELIHLLFVGIAVAYGLFSRRNVESSSVGVDLRMNNRVVDESSLSYVSRIFQVSSVFDDEELENPNSCEFDVRSEIHSINSSVVVKERKSDESFVVESGFEESSSSSEVRAWNSQYFQGRSKVMVARPAYGLDGHVVHQPLGLPVRSLRSALEDNSFADSSNGTVNEKTESLVDSDEVIAAAAAAPTPSSSPVVPWPEMMGIGDNYDYSSNFQPQSVDENYSSNFQPQSVDENYSSNFQPQSVDETQFGSHKSRSSRSSRSSSQTSLASHTQNRYSPSRSVSEEESLNSNVEESVKEEKSSSSRSSSPSLPPSPSLSLSSPSPTLPPSPPLPPSPKLITDDDDDTRRRRFSHSRHYSDGSLLKEDESERSNKIRGRITEPGSKSLKLSGESSRRRNKSRRSYPPDSIKSPPPIDDPTTRRKRREIQQKSDDQDNSTTRKELVESDLNNNPRGRKQWSRNSLELISAEAIAKEDEKFTESFPSMDVLFQPTNAKASRRAMHSSREKDVTRNSEDEDFDKKLRKKDISGNNNNKELKSNSLRSEPQQSWRGSSKLSSRGKSVRTFRGKELVTYGGESSDDRGGEAKVEEETRGRTKPRRQWKEELAIVPHVLAKTEPEEEDDDDVMEEEKEAEEQQPQVSLEEEEEEEAAWESQSNASHDHNEVDRKAGEFIAKFREQIRLQKLTSGEQPRGGGGGGGGGSGIMRNSHYR